MTKFTVGQRVWVSPLARWDTIREVTPDGYYLEGWQVARFAESHLQSEAEREAYHARVEATPQPSAEETRRKELKRLGQMREVDPTWGRNGFGIGG